MATATQEGLAKIAQADFSAGSFQSVARHLIPHTGLYSAENSLFDEDGAIYRRGGSRWIAAAAVGTSGRMVWDGVLAVGARTFYANPDDFAVLAADDSAFLNIGGPGLAAPQRATVFDGVLILDDGTVYGGSRKTTGVGGTSCTVTNGSKTVTATGTPAFLTNLDAGMLFRPNSPGTGRFYVLESVDSNTQVTLKDAYQGATASGLAYNFTAYGNVTDNATGYVAATGGYASIFNRLLAARGRILSFTGGRQADGTVLHTFGADDNHEFSGTILGVQPIRDLTFVFTTDGVFAVTGMAFDLLDPDGVNFQQQVELVNSDLILWGKEGMATYQNQMLVPGVDGLWTMGPAAAPVLLSRSIQARWRAHVAAGYKPGVAAVYRNHYYLPVLDSSNVVVDVMVCRLDRPTSSDIGTVFPWSFWTGQGGNVPAFATRVSGSSARQPKLLAADRGSGRLMDLTTTFEPSATNKNDADGTTHAWQVEGRDDATGNGNHNHVRRLKIWYELVDAGSDDPHISGWFSVGGELPGTPHWDEVNWDEFNWTGDDTEVTPFEGQAPPDSGRNPYTWHFIALTRFIRWRLRCADPVASLKLRSTEWSIRPSGKAE